MSNGFWGNMWISCFFIATFHQIAVYSLCFGPSWLLIHLMLKFILIHSEAANDCRNFNTSHVKVYQKKLQTKLNCFIVSIHPMLKFIRPWRRCGSMVVWVSIHPMLNFIKQPDNLPKAFIHVLSTVYPIQPLSFLYNHLSLYRIQNEITETVCP